MTRLGTITPKDFVKSLNPSREQKLKADTCVPILDYYGEGRKEGRSLEAD